MKWPFCKKDFFSVSTKLLLLYVVSYHLFLQARNYQSSSSVWRNTANSEGQREGRASGDSADVLCSWVFCLLSGPQLWPQGKQDSSESDWAIPLASLGGQSFLSCCDSFPLSVCATMHAIFFLFFFSNLQWSSRGKLVPAQGAIKSDTPDFWAANQRPLREACPLHGALYSPPFCRGAGSSNMVLMKL